MCQPNRLMYSDVFVGSGMKPTRFEKKMNSASVATNGNQRAAMRRSMLPPTTLFWRPWKITSTSVCTRFGRCCMRRPT